MNSFVSRLESQGNNNLANIADSGQDRKPLSVLQSNGVCMQRHLDDGSSAQRRVSAVAPTRRIYDVFPTLLMGTQHLKAYCRMTKKAHGVCRYTKIIFCNVYTIYMF